MECSKTFVEDECEESESNARRAEIRTLDEMTDHLKKIMLLTANASELL